MLAVDPDPPSPISSFLKTLTLEDSREPFVLPIIEDSDLDLFDLGLEEVFMANNGPKVEEEGCSSPYKASTSTTTNLSSNTLYSRISNKIDLLTNHKLKTFVHS